MFTCASLFESLMDTGVSALTHRSNDHTNTPYSIHTVNGRNHFCSIVVNDLCMSVLGFATGPKTSLNMFTCASLFESFLDTAVSALTHIWNDHTKTPYSIHTVNGRNHFCSIVVNDLCISVLSFATGPKTSSNTFMCITSLLASDFSIRVLFRLWKAKEVKEAACARTILKRTEWHRCRSNYLISEFPRA